MLVLGLYMYLFFLYMYHYSRHFCHTFKSSEALPPLSLCMLCLKVITSIETLVYQASICKGSHSGSFTATQKACGSVLVAVH